MFFVGMLAVPESPTWLARSGQHARVRRVLVRIGREDHCTRALAEIE
jgi:Sugar (and other) transporter